VCANVIDKDATMTQIPARRIAHGDQPIVLSPSGLPSQHLVARWCGATSIFVGQQWLQPGERVLLHTHPVEEALVFLAGTGEAILGDEWVPVAAETTLYVPPELPHGFRNDGSTPLHVLVVFPGPDFAETRLLEPLEEERS
jgi:quercetin dioxygenase-like cupin family protein